MKPVLSDTEDYPNLGVIKISHTFRSVDTIRIKVTGINGAITKVLFNADNVNNMTYGGAEYNTVIQTVSGNNQIITISVGSSTNDLILLVDNNVNEIEITYPIDDSEDETKIPYHRKFVKQS